MTIDPTRDLHYQRNFRAPLALLWEVWTQPRHLTHWWGPKGFSTVTEQMDLRSGGRWKHVMVGPDGRRYPNETVFEEVRPQALIRYRNRGSSADGPDVSFESTWSFKSISPGETSLEIHMRFDTPEGRRTAIDVYGAAVGAEQMLSRLEHVLVTTEALAKPDASREIVIDRWMAASRERVWAAWTKPEAVDRWWGPDGFRTVTSEMEVSTGGRWRYLMHGPDGKVWDNRMVYVEVIPGERLVYVLSSDVDDAPDRFVSEVTFREERGGTLVTLRSIFASAAVRQDVERFGATEGGRQTLAHLDAYLAAG